MKRCFWMLGLTTALIFATAASGDDADGAKKGKGNFAKDPEALFKKMDANGDGKISKEEFKKFFSEMAAKFGKGKDKADGAGDKFADKIFEKLDADGDGFLSKEEFKKFAEMRGGFGPGKGKKKPDNP